MLRVDTGHFVRWRKWRRPREKISDRWEKMSNSKYLYTNELMIAVRSFVWSVFSSSFHSFQRNELCINIWCYNCTKKWQCHKKRNYILHGRMVFASRFWITLVCRWQTHKNWLINCVRRFLKFDWLFRLCLVDRIDGNFVFLSSLSVDVERLLFPLETNRLFEMPFDMLLLMS